MGILGINITSSNDVITLTGAGSTPFVNTDLQYVVVIKSINRKHIVKLMIVKNYCDWC